MGPAESAATAAGFQYLVDVRARRFDGGNNPEDQTGKQRNEQSEPEDTSVKGKINRANEKERRAEGPQDDSPPKNDEQFNQAAEQRNDTNTGKKPTNSKKG